MNPEERRKHKRITLPKGVFASWKASDRSGVARIHDLGRGGAYLITPTPTPSGAAIEVVLCLPVGKVAVRAMVKRCRPLLGMGIEFLQMPSEDRAKLNEFLAQSAEKESRKGHSQVPTGQPDANVLPEESPFDREFARLSDLARKGSHYQLLGVERIASASEIKRNYYALAKKFHPDLHMDKPELSNSLKELMEKITLSYHTLRDAQKREEYDKKLSAAGAFNLARAKSESEETVEECMARVEQYFRAGNLVGSINWLRKCVILAPNNSRYHTMLGRSLATVPAYKDEAMLHFERAVELDPWNVEAYFCYAEFYEALKLPWRAQPLYAKILEIDPDHRKAQQRVAVSDLDSAKGRTRGFGETLLSRFRPSL